MTRTRSPDLTDWGRDVVRPRREELGLTRDQLAAMCGTHPETLRNLETGSVRSPYHSTLRRVCQTLGLPLPIEGPADDRVVLCLTGTDAPAVVRILSASLFEFVRRRADARRFAAYLTPRRSMAARRALAALVVADRQLAQRLLDTLPPRWLSSEAPPPRPRGKKGPTPAATPRRHRTHPTEGGC
jgi:transcriptional regulator with XRE-family HTH domain